MFKKCGTKDCQNPTFQQEEFCGACNIRRAAVREAEYGEAVDQFRRDMAKLERMLRFEAWADEHDAA